MIMILVLAVEITQKTWLKLQEKDSTSILKKVFLQEQNHAFSNQQHLVIRPVKRKQVQFYRAMKSINNFLFQSLKRRLCLKGQIQIQKLALVTAIRFLITPNVEDSIISIDCKQQHHQEGHFGIVGKIDQQQNFEKLHIFL